MKAKLEIFLDGQWKLAATLTSLDDLSKRYTGASRLEYDIGFVSDHLDRPQEAALSVRYPVSFDFLNEDRWPAFVLDLLPSGHARRVWLKRLSIIRNTTAPSDWALLLNGAGNPPGSIRIQEACLPKTPSHPGFTLQDILERHEDFTEYAEQHGAAAAGSSGAQGDAPKILLVLDHQQRWHADGAVPDPLICEHWIVKFPRGNGAKDKQILRNEAAYMTVAQRVGIDVYDTLIWQQDSLFIPRFDRQVNDGSVMRYGLESLTSATGTAEFGIADHHESYCDAIINYSTAADEDLIEYVQRDILNVAMGNTDNHGRNHALLKVGGEVRLSPLFDFAPMFLDQQGIARVTRWSRKHENPGESPDWQAIAEYLQPWSPNIQNRLMEFAHSIENLTEIMRESGVDDLIINRRSHWIESTLISLRKIQDSSPEWNPHGP